MSPIHTSASIFSLEVKEREEPKSFKQYVVTKHLQRFRFTSLKEAEIWAKIGGGAALIEEVEISQEALAIPTLDWPVANLLEPTREPLTNSECKWCRTLLTESEDRAGWKLCQLCRLDAGV